jgi:hypothetical protein
MSHLLTAWLSAVSQVGFPKPESLRSEELLGSIGTRQITAVVDV